jgi:hypothetical protein
MANFDPEIEFHKSLGRVRSGPLSKTVRPFGEYVKGLSVSGIKNSEIDLTRLIVGDLLLSVPCHIYGSWRGSVFLVC